MELICAVDLLGGRVVRLHKGDYEQVTVYADDPVAQARAFVDAGASRVHVVDLDGARDGRPGHLEVMKRIVAATSAPVQVGGGIRDADAARAWLDAGADRIVLGTFAVREPEQTRALCDAHPGRVLVAIDARGEEVAIEGWREGGGRRVLDLAREADAWGAVGLLYTDIDRDGTGEGPAVARTAALQAEVSCTVIASGGIGSVDDLVALREAGIREAVCGRALYEGAFDVADGVRAARGEG